VADVHAGVSSVNALEQLAYGNLESASELHDIFNPEVSFAAFNPADVRPMQPRFFGKFFLGPFSFESQFADSLPKKSEGGRRTPAHRRVLFRMTRYSAIDDSSKRPIDIAGFEG